MTGALVQRLTGAFRRRQRAPKLSGPALISAFADAYPEAYFIEIGSNDGEQHDHLRPFILSRSWRGVMVEPVPYVFDRLRSNYGGLDRVSLENAAIADRDGTLPFYYVVDADPAERDRLPDWYDGIGSFSREKVLAHRKSIPDIDERLVERDVECLTFDTLCGRHGAAGKVDLVVIDTEGYDAEILRSIDLRAHRPRMIVYEHFHLDPSERERSSALLEESGYEVVEEGFDTFALLPADGDSLDRAWQRFEPAVAGVSVHDEA